MPHLPEEALTLLALGEPASAQEQSHLDSCPYCAGELAAFGRVVAVGRDTAPGSRSGGTAGPSNEDGSPAGGYPPPAVWEGIHSTLGLSDAVRADPAGQGGQVIDLSLRRRGSGNRDSAGTAEASASAGTRGRSGAGGPSRSRSIRRWLPAAAAAAAVLAGAAVWGVVQGQDREPELLAAAELQPLPAYQETGRAEVDRLPDGRRELVVVASGSDAAGYREVWLLAPDAQSMVSLGTMEGTEARFPLPDDLDLDSYPVVDISDEPFDGNPAHSGDSILRGELEL